MYHDLKQKRVRLVGFKAHTSWVFDLQLRKIVSVKSFLSFFKLTERVSERGQTGILIFSYYFCLDSRAEVFREHRIVHHRNRMY